MGTLKTLLLGQALLAILDSKEVSSQVLKLSNAIDKEIDTRFPSRSEEIQSAIVSKVLLPLCTHLLRENQKEWMKILQVEYGVVRDEFISDKPEAM